jgi:hypothetical protein
MGDLLRAGGTAGFGFVRLLTATPVGTTRPYYAQPTELHAASSVI